MKVLIDIETTGRATATSPEYPEVSVTGETAIAALAGFEEVLKAADNAQPVKSCENCKINCEIKHIWSAGRCEKWRLDTGRKGP